MLDSVNAQSRQLEVYVTQQSQSAGESFELRNKLYQLEMQRGEDVAQACAPLHKTIEELRKELVRLQSHKDTPPVMVMKPIVFSVGSQTDREVVVAPPTVTPPTTAATREDSGTTGIITKLQEAIEVITQQQLLKIQSSMPPPSSATAPTKAAAPERGGSVKGNPPVAETPGKLPEDFMSVDDHDIIITSSSPDSILGDVDTSPEQEKEQKGLEGEDPLHAHSLITPIKPTFERHHVRFNGWPPSSDARTTEPNAIVQLLSQYKADLQVHSLTTAAVDGLLSMYGYRQRNMR